VGISGPLSFADADNFRSSVLQFVKATHHPHAVVIDLTAATTMDMDGVRALSRLAHELRSKHVRVLLTHVGTDHLDLLRRTGGLDELGADNIHPTVRAAVATAQTTDKALDA
jgi:sulfate permease, SulP family